MTPEFKQAFEKLCERWPEKFKVSHLSPYWILDPNDVCIYSASDDTRYLWFLHKLAESLGGVVWVDALRPISYLRDIAGWRGNWDNGKIDCGLYVVNVENGNHVKAQTLALESAVVGLIEAKLNEKEE